MTSSIHILRDCRLGTKVNPDSGEEEPWLEGPYFASEDGTVLAGKLLKSFEDFEEKVPQVRLLGRNMQSAEEVRNQYIRNCSEGISVMWVRDVRNLLGWASFTPDPERRGWWVALFIEGKERTEDDQRPTLKRFYHRMASDRALMDELQSPMEVSTGAGGQVIPIPYRWLMVQSGRSASAFIERVKRIGFHVWKRIDRRVYEEDEQGHKDTPLTDPNGAPEMEHIVQMRMKLEDVAELSREGEAA